MPRALLSRAASRAVLCCSGALLAAGCAGDAIHSRATPLAARAHVIVGRPMILPIHLEGRLDPRPRLRLDDGRDAQAHVVWISATPEPADPGWAWLPPAAQWTATPADAPSRPSAVGFWAAVVDLPPDAVGQGLWVGGQRLELDWLPDPLLVAPPGDQMLWAPPLDAATRSSPMLARLAAPEARDPFRRWRWRLAFEGLEPAPDDNTFADPIIDALAASVEARWQVGLAWLWRHDPALARDLKRALVRVARDANHGPVPAWSSDSIALDSLLNDIADPSLDPERRAERARAWLDDQPALAAWVVDDAGIRDGSTGAAIPTIALANLTDAPAVVLCAWPDAPSAPEMVRVEPDSIQRAPITPPDPPAPRTLRVEAERDAVELAVAGPIRAEPPGVHALAFFTDWTMPDWLAGQPTRSADTAFRLYAEPGDDGLESWFLYAECAITADPERDILRVWLGPVERPASVIRIASDGQARDERANAILQGAVVTRRADRWSALVPIPTHAIELDGTLRIAVERIDASSRRTCWPRPLLPWQAEPGRALVDLNAWNPRIGGR